MGDKIGIANSFNNIAEIYSFQCKKFEAMEYYTSTFKKIKEIEDKPGMANAYFYPGIELAVENKISESLPVFYNRPLS